MGPHGFLDDRQAKTRAAKLACGGCIGLRKRLEQPSKLIRSHADARVPDRETELQPLLLPIFHTDAGSVYTAIRFGGALAEVDFRPSIGSVGDAYDNALAETTIGLYKTECVRPGSPFNPHGLTTLTDVAVATADWVHWYNTRRLMHRLGRRPPAEAEAEYYAQHPKDAVSVDTTTGGG